jgi:hypothetical protein
LAALRDRKASPDHKARQDRTRSVTATHNVIETHSAIATHNAIATGTLTTDHVRQASIKRLTMMEGPSASETSDSWVTESSRIRM